MMNVRLTELPPKWVVRLTVPDSTPVTVLSAPKNALQVTQILRGKDADALPFMDFDALVGSNLL